MNYMPKYKIVFIDIDGTLYNSKSKITKFTKDIITKLSKKGVLVVLTSGRNSYQVRAISQSVNASNYIIASNGAEVYDYLNDIDIYQSNIDYLTVEKIYQYCQEHNLKLYLNTKYKRLVNQRDSGFPENTYVSSLEEIKGNIISQIVVQSSNFNRMLVLKDLFHTKYPILKNANSSSQLRNLQHQANDVFFRDFILENTSKSSGIVKLLEYLKIPAEEAISLGDSYNDISMFELTGLSIAMGNAIPEIQKQADRVTLSNNQDGVAYALKNIFKID